MRGSRRNKRKKNSLSFGRSEMKNYLLQNNKKKKRKE
jgi:hypothetical protein